jgi:hypothetical protein
MRKLRWPASAGLFVGVALLCCGGATPAAAATRADYEATMRCYVVNAVASDRLKERGEAARAEAYEAKAKRSFDLALKMGRDLGIADPVINRDFQNTEYNELPKLRYETGYFAKAAATCRARGLM